MHPAFFISDSPDPSEPVTQASLEQAMLRTLAPGVYFPWNAESELVELLSAVRDRIIGSRRGDAEGAASLLESTGNAPEWDSLGKRLLSTYGRQYKFCRSPEALLRGEIPSPPRDPGRGPPAPEARYLIQARARWEVRG